MQWSDHFQFRLRPPGRLLCSFSRCRQLATEVNSWGLSFVKLSHPHPQLRTFLVVDCKIEMTVPVNGGFASPLADADYAVPQSHNTGGFVSWVYDGLSGFNLIAIGLLTIVLYDQCGFCNLDISRALLTLFDLALNIYQSSMFGIREPLWDPDGRFRSWAPSSNLCTRRWMFTRPNGRVAI